MILHFLHLAQFYTPGNCALRQAPWEAGALGGRAGKSSYNRVTPQLLHMNGATSSAWYSYSNSAKENLHMPSWGQFVIGFAISARTPGCFIQGLNIFSHFFPKNYTDSKYNFISQVIFFQNYTNSGRSEMPH